MYSARVITWRSSTACFFPFTFYLTLEENFAIISIIIMGKLVERQGRKAMVSNRIYSYDRPAAGFYGNACSRSVCFAQI